MREPTLEYSGGGAECDAARREGLGEGQPDGDADRGHEREDADVDHIGHEGRSGRHLVRRIIVISGYSDSG